MKELSIEEKAKRYDEAIEKLRSLHDDYDTVSTLIDVKEELENIFPELAESEDEGISREITEFLVAFNNGGYERPNENTIDSWLSWLEKQGEQKPVEHTDLKTWKYIVDAVLTEREGIGQYIDSPWTTEAAEKLQKRFGTIEQKPV